MDPSVVDFTGLGAPPSTPPPLLPVTEFADEGVMDPPRDGFDRRGGGDGPPP